MRFYRHLYRTSNIREMEIAAIRRRMSRKKLKLHDYAVCIDPAGTDQLVIYSGYEWNSPRVHPKECAVVGIGRGYFPTIYMVSRMVQDVYRDTGDAFLAAYFLDRDPSLKKEGGDP